MVATVDRELGHRGVIPEHALHLRGRDRLAPGADDVAQPAHDAQIAVRVDCAAVARAWVPIASAALSLASESAPMAMATSPVADAAARL